MTKGISVVRTIGLTTALAAWSVAAMAADPAAGKEYFAQACVICHTAEVDDNGGNQGPSLIGVFGRKAGGDSGFDYTKELKDSGLTWDAESLDKFLAAPGEVVPGTFMLIPVTDKTLRENVIAYLQGIATKSAALGDKTRAAEQVQAGDSHARPKATLASFTK